MATHEIGTREQWLAARLGLRQAKEERALAAAQALLYALEVIREGLITGVCGAESFILARVQDFLCEV